MVGRLPQGTVLCVELGKYGSDSTRGQGSECSFCFDTRGSFFPLCVSCCACMYVKHRCFSVVELGLRTAG